MDWTGLRTYLVAALVATLPNLTAWLLGIDWVGVLTNIGVPQIAIIPIAGLLAGAIQGFMRSITTTPAAPVSQLFAGSKPDGS
ncbi:MAG TPA: hypothetical protein VIF61_00290 [Methylocystis sp.]|jgi:hypothetical protein